eukprot:1176748-Prorocentrum_minimum.AAC.4
MKSVETLPMLTPIVVACAQRVSTCLAIRAPGLAYAILAGECKQEDFGCDVHVRLRPLAISFKPPKPSKRKKFRTT